jgi:hypothetical protein
MDRTSGIVAACCVLVALAVSGCIDSSQRMATCPVDPAHAESAPAAPSSCPGKIQPATDGVLDDFEDGDSQVTKIDGRDGYWFTSHDDKGSTIGPTPLKMAEGGAGGSAKSLRITGQTSSENGAWGILFGANFAAQGLYDASRHAGIAFKAKADGASVKKVRFKVGDVNTHPDGGVCKTCWNHFGKDLVLTTDWKDYTVTFAEMKQEAGWGERFPSITPSKLISINWSVGPGQAVDLSIDDVQFVDCM